MAIAEDMKCRYYRWLYTLHQKFIQHATMAKTLAHPPKSIVVDDWKYLINLWESDKWMVCLILKIHQKYILLI